MAQWLTREAREANTIKRQTPIMCVIGNPPYSGESANKVDWIMGLMEAYKKEPGGKEKLKERNPKWINDDYVKFIRFAEHLIEKTGEGVLGFITNHGYLDNPTFRGMRWHLLDTFDKIFVLDLHGNASKKEVSPDGEADKNVFDIQQGVSILIGVKSKKSTKKLADVFHGDLWGGRAEKYQALLDSGLGADFWQKVEPTSPQFAFGRRDFQQAGVYDSGFSIGQFLPVNSVGIVTANDELCIDMDRELLWNRVQGFAKMDPTKATETYGRRTKEGKLEEARDWRVSWAQADIQSVADATALTPISYRPFDTRWTFYTGRSRGFMCYPRHEVMRHMVGRENICLIYSRQAARADTGYNHVIVANSIFDNRGVYSNKGISQAAPLYLYPTEQDLDQSRRINFDPKLYARLQALAKHPTHGTPDEVAVFDYIYGVLHCPAYRTTYAEFLKIDFPRIPWPASPDEFWDVSAKGTRLRNLHLMDPATIGPTPYPFKGEGNAVVDKPRFEDGRVWINTTQYFDNAPEVSWTFYIGGYQPAQKWLKDRKGRALSFDDVKHYQRILKILSETDRIVQTITMTLETT